jgi:hypothetical protein
MNYLTISDRNAKIKPLLFNIGINMTELQDAYNEYWAARKAKQAADRDNLDGYLLPQRERLARAIVAQQAEGRNVTELQDEVNNKNRNFLYSILKGVPYINKYKAAEPDLPSVVSANDAKAWQASRLGTDKFNRELWSYQVVDNGDSTYVVKLWCDSESVERTVVLGVDNYPVVEFEWTADDNMLRASEMSKALTDIRKLAGSEKPHSDLPESTDY